MCILWHAKKNPVSPNPNIRYEAEVRKKQISKTFILKNMFWRKMPWPLVLRRVHQKVFLEIKDMLRVQVVGLNSCKIICLVSCENFANLQFVCWSIVLLCMSDGCKKTWNICRMHASHI